MKTWAIPAIILLSLGTAAAGRHQPTAEAGSVQELLLQQIKSESDDAKKLVLLEQFAAAYPQHEALPWVYEQMIDSYSKTSQLDKALGSCDKLLALDPADVESAHACLKTAEAKKDPDLVLKYSAAASAAARKVAAAPRPDDESEDGWKDRVEFARGVDTYSEYSLYAMALQTASLKKKMQLSDALEQRNPQSQYLPQLTEHIFLASIQAGDTAKAVALAERIVAKNPDNEDMLLAVASSYLTSKQPDKALALAGKVIGVTNAKARPEGVNEADWQTHKLQVTGRAEWIRGVVYAGQRKWAAADHSLRAALPGIKNSQEITAESLFYLGVANYQLAEAGEVDRALDAVRFSEQCAAIAGRYQEAARKNIRAIRAKYQIQQ